MTIDQTQINNLLSGLVGGLIAVIFTSFLDRISNAIRLNRIRLTILDYLKHIGLDKTLQYAEDMEYVKQSILTTDEKEIHKKDKRSVDAMPMLTSELFKNFQPDELRQVCYNGKNYIMMLDIYYSIDFLKSYMPLDIYQKYLEKVNAHYEEKGLETGKEQLEHLKTCGVMKQFANEAANEASVKYQRATVTHQVIHDVIDKLNGWGIWWTIKYLV